MDKSRENIFQRTIIDYLCAHGWKEGRASNFDAILALYPDDLIRYVRDTQPEKFERLEKFHGSRTREKILERAAKQMDQRGSLEVLRHGFKDHGASIDLCTFKPDHGLNPELLARYDANRLRIVEEVRYSPHARPGEYNPRLDLVLFVNGIPVATLELKSEFKQSVENAKKQYKFDRPPKDPKTRREEPLLAFRRRALVHFALGKEEAWMTTKLAGKSTFFLPFNRGHNGGKGNPPEDGYATEYLWRDVFQRDAWLNILGRFIHLEKKDGKEKLIFPRFHQWQAVNKLIHAAKSEGPGHRYLVQHSAGSGKSNSIAWTAHQLASAHDENEERIFDSVIVITDRTVLDAQLQETIYQFEHKDGVVVRISREEGTGTKSEQLADALERSARIIIVTIQTFPFVLQMIQERSGLSGRRFAIIADEAHSSQTGATAAKLRQVLLAEQLDDADEISAEDVMVATLASRGPSPNLSYFAFTATPKAKTIELFGRPPNPDEPISADNRPEAFHVYTMQQAIEEGFILDVLERYTTYDMAFRLEKKAEEEIEVDKSRGAQRIFQWVKLHPYNIDQKVEVIVEHFRQHVAHLLEGHAKAMVVTDSRKAAVRYQLALERHVAKKQHDNVHALVAFSGELNDPDSGPGGFTETNMNPGLRGRDLRDAFDTPDYQVMIVANKFQTGFDQPKLCAMYVDKKLSGVDCVQTLSRLNRTYPGKEAPFVLDFVNKPEDILDAFKPYYRTAELQDVSDPNQIYDIQHKLEAERIFTSDEVDRFAEVAFDPKTKTDEKMVREIRPARDRYKSRYSAILDELAAANRHLKQAEAKKDDREIERCKAAVKSASESKSELDLFKKNLGTFVRFYEFISQVTDLRDEDLEKLSIFCRHLLPLLRTETEIEDIDLTGIELSYYRLRKLDERDLRLRDAEGDEGLKPASELGTGAAREREKDTLEAIIERLNELYGAGDWSENDVVNHARTVADKVMENDKVRQQIENNTDEQVMLGDYPTALQDAMMDSLEAQKGLSSRFFSDPEVQKGVAALVLQLIRHGIGREDG